MINDDHKYLFNGIAMLFDCGYGHGCSFFIRIPVSFEGVMVYLLYHMRF
ncbi:hypothetical protein HanXRQr2_Chr16g0730361 [Helianthus annuus]|uniref:Uncharacterized protein n=1 Tax=Helianthus annuus TaxID=4232 RepID=A0A9K3DQJ4_HELAN|nr:hypothetical protein HanXRQr2_Chr16g0730361 [Helianthus annuus]